MGTDYSSYYVEYSCLSQDSSSKCSKPSVTLWTRTLSLESEAYVDARKTVIGLCLNLDDLVNVDHTHGNPFVGPRRECR